MAQRLRKPCLPVSLGEFDIADNVFDINDNVKYLTNVLPLSNATLGSILKNLLQTLHPGTNCFRIAVERGGHIRHVSMPQFVSLDAA